MKTTGAAALARFCGSDRRAACRPYSLGENSASGSSARATARTPEPKPYSSVKMTSCAVDAAEKQQEQEARDHQADADDRAQDRVAAPAEQHVDQPRGNADDAACRTELQRQRRRRAVLSEDLEQRRRQAEGDEGGDRRRRRDQQEGLAPAGGRQRDQAASACPGSPACRRRPVSAAQTDKAAGRRKVQGGADDDRCPASRRWALSSVRIGQKMVADRPVNSIRMAMMRLPFMPLALDDGGIGRSRQARARRRSR